MNLLEQYIVEIHSVESYKEGWTEEFDTDFVEVKMTTNCYGVTETKKRVFNVQEWEVVKKQGYYMA